jgi:hypothetical protein
MSNSIFQQLDFNDFAKDCKEFDIDFTDAERETLRDALNDLANRIQVCANKL